MRNQKAFPEKMRVALLPNYYSVVKAFVAKTLRILDGPVNIPNLNPIENLWYVCKRGLRKFDCTTKVTQIEAAIQTWFHEAENE